MPTRAGSPGSGLGAPVTVRTTFPSFPPATTIDSSCTLVPQVVWSLVVGTGASLGGAPAKLTTPLTSPATAGAARSTARVDTTIWLFFIWRLLFGEWCRGPAG